MRITTNSNKNLVNEIREKLKETGGYCTCSPIRTPDTKCMCKAFREQEDGECHCGSYVNYKDGKNTCFIGSLTTICCGII